MAKKLTKAEDEMILGVCGEIAEWLGIDPTIVRLIFAVAFFYYEIVGIAYLIAFIVMPEAD